MTEKTIRTYDFDGDWFSPFKQPDIKVFSLTRYQALRLKANEKLTIIRPIPPLLRKHPSVMQFQEDKTDNLFYLPTAEPQIVPGSATLWHYVGDGTHYSEAFSTPHGWKVGDEFLAENRYNVPRCTLRVVSIDLQQNPIDYNWFWVVTLEK